MHINIGAQQNLRYPGAIFNEKQCLQVWGVDALRASPPVLSMRPCETISHVQV
jgi:hypothetical protein